MSEPAVKRPITRGRKRLIRRVLQSDPTQEYLVYIPSSGGAEAPMFVTIHGVSRNADQHARLFSAYCELYGVVLVAPVFSEEQHPDYQRLGRVGRGKRSDLALNQIVAEVAGFTGCLADRFHLFGFSGGAQFAHRYVMAHPHRVEGAVVAAAGWYTLPDATRRFPKGTRSSSKLPGVLFDAEEFLSVPMTVFVGDRDNNSKGVRRNPRLDREQGESRIERAQNWTRAMREAATAHQLEPRVEFHELENCSHSFKKSVLRSGLGDRIFEAMFGPPPHSADARDGSESGS